MAAVTINDGVAVWMAMREDPKLLIDLLDGPDLSARLTDALVGLSQLVTVLGRLVADDCDVELETVVAEVARGAAAAASQTGH